MSLEEMRIVSVELVTFQLASTAFTVTVNPTPVVRSVGVPDLPVALPGNAVSPGINNCNFVNAPAFTDVAGLVFAVLVPSLISVAVTVRLPAVLKVTLKVLVPATRAAFAGNVALESLVVMPAVCVELTTFQFASTALTVTLKAVPAVRSVGVPIFPVVVPAAAVSPGIKSCNLENAAAFTVVDGLVLLVLVPSEISVAVKVRLPAVFKVTLKVCVPATSAAVAGKAALVSLEVMPTMSVELTTFQLVSTELTVTVKAEPAVRAVGVPVFPLAVPGAAVSPGINNCNLTNALAAPALITEESIAAMVARRSAVVILTRSLLPHTSPPVSRVALRPNRQ